MFQTRSAVGQPTDTQLRPGQREVLLRVNTDTHHVRPSRSRRGRGGESVRRVSYTRGASGAAAQAML